MQIARQLSTRHFPCLTEVHYQVMASLNCMYSRKKGEGTAGDLLCLHLRPVFVIMFADSGMTCEIRRVAPAAQGSSLSVLGRSVLLKALAIAVILTAARRNRCDSASLQYAPAPVARQSYLNVGSSRNGNEFVILETLWTPTPP
jgi:hypothetical protein